MKLNRKWLLVLALVLSLSVATAGTLAYLTDRDTVENTFTMGKVDIEVEEDFPEGGAPIKPGEEVNKDAQITNEGTNPAWVWMTVSIPETLVDYVTLNWTLDFKEAATGPEVVDGQAVWTVLVEDPLPAGESTGYILDSVTLSPFVDYQSGEYVVVEDGTPVPLEGLENGSFIVTVNGYAVQTDEFDSVQQARRAYQRQYGEETTPVMDGRVEYNGTIYDNIYVGVEEAAKNGGGTVRLLGSATMDHTLTIPDNITIEGDGHVYSRADEFIGTMFDVAAGVTLNVNDLTMDGAGATATGNLIATTSGHIILNNGTVLKNNHGAHAVNLATRAGGTLTLNGAEISNNSSGSGAIWGGGHIIVNEGSKINNNASSDIGGAIRMVGGANFTMNGGEMCNNTAVTNGGAIYGYGDATNKSSFTFNGGEISGNEAGGVGGALYSGKYATVVVSGNFVLADNTANNTGGFRLMEHSSFTMTGGKISGNTSNENAQTSGLYGYSCIMKLSDGEIADNVLIEGGYVPTVGGTDLSGVVKLNITPVHNTVYLVENFGTFQYLAAGNYFDAFHFQPATGYTYTAGDEAKLICLNEGYSTYWDATTNTFKLKAE